MVTKRDSKKQLVSSEGLLMSEVIQLEAIINIPTTEQ
jgi:hypothetical protein